MADESDVHQINHTLGIGPLRQPSTPRPDKLSIARASAVFVLLFMTIGAVLTTVTIFLPRYVHITLTPWLRIFELGVSLWDINVETRHAMGGAVPLIDSPVGDMFSSLMMHRVHKNHLRQVVDYVCHVDAATSFILAIGCLEITAVYHAAVTAIVLLSVSASLQVMAIAFTVIHFMSVLKGAKREILPEYSQVSQIVLIDLMLVAAFQGATVFQFAFFGIPTAWAASQHHISLAPVQQPLSGLGWGFFCCFGVTLWHLVAPAVVYYFIGRADAAASLSLSDVGLRDLETKPLLESLHGEIKYFDHQSRFFGRNPTLDASLRVDYNPTVFPAPFPPHPIMF